MRCKLTAKRDVFLGIGTSGEMEGLVIVVLIVDPVLLLEGPQVLWVEVINALRGPEPKSSTVVHRSAPSARKSGQGNSTEWET